MNPISVIKHLFDSDPEHRVYMDEHTVTLECKGLLETRILWSELDEIALYALPYSLMIPSIVWSLHANSKVLTFSNRAEGADAVISKLHNFPYFDSVLYAKYVLGGPGEPVVLWRRDWVLKTDVAKGRPITDERP